MKTRFFKHANGCGGWIMGVNKIGTFYIRPTGILPATKGHNNWGLSTALKHVKNGHWIEVKRPKGKAKLEETK